MAKDPSNLVLLEKITNVYDVLKKVETHAEKTNGRVTSLEAWKNKTVGAIIVMNVILLPMALNLLMK
jgi:hypothetical protein